MADWVRDGTHKLSRWEAILPSMTSASQAGILHGTNDGIPAFRWWERDRQYLMAGLYVANHCHVLCALWDGSDEGGVGGTAHIVRYYLGGPLPGPSPQASSRAWQRGQPLRWLPSPLRVRAQPSDGSGSSAVVPSGRGSAPMA